MKTKCLLVDDEPLAIRLLEKHLGCLEQFQVVATCLNAVKAYEVLQSTPVDLLFLDIKMPQLSGLDFLKTIRNPPKTILTTAYRDFALDGFDLGVVDYLLKPITFERFMKSIDRFLSLFPPTQAPKPTAEKESPQHIVVKSGSKYQKIPVGDILFIESLREYVKIVTRHTEVITKYKISDLEAEVESLGFLRVHRSFLVNTHNITAFSTIEIELATFRIPVGASYKTLMKKVLKFE